MVEHVISLGPLIYEISRLQEPVVTIDPGDSVVVETEDAFSGQVRVPGDVRDRVALPLSDPVAGPIVVNGAEPGDALSVHIVDIEPLIGQSATYVLPAPPVVTSLGSPTPDMTRICQIADGRIRWSKDLTIPYRPMIGLIACAPAMGAPTTVQAGDYGGNMDIREVAPGATVMLPVFVPGGFLYLGDCHAAQGAAEVSGIALEMPARSRIVIDLEKGVELRWPRIETDSELMAIACGRPLDEAVGLAFSRLAVWLERSYGWARWEALSLLSQVGEVSVGYYWGGGVAAKVSKSLVQRTEEASLKVAAGAAQEHHEE